jgi:hypothetical protein
MIRVLATIAVAGFLVSVGTITAAVAIAGPDAIAHGAWTWSPHGWGSVDHVGDSKDDDASRETATTTREIAWSGGDTLTVEVPADVKVARTAGSASVTVSGPAQAVADVEIEDGVVRWREGHDDDDDAHLNLVVTAPTVTRFVMKRHGVLTTADLAPPPAAKPSGR